MNDEELNDEILRTIAQTIDKCNGKHRDKKYSSSWHSVGCCVHPSTNLIYMLECERTYHIEIKDGDIVISDYNAGRGRHVWQPVAIISLADPECFDKVVDKAFEIRGRKNRNEL
jgi:hypothetical protein